MCIQPRSTKKPARLVNCFATDSRGTLLVRIVEGAAIDFYHLRRVGCSYGILFELTKFATTRNGERGRPAVYHVGFDPECNGWQCVGGACKGFLQHGHCKHHECLQALLAAGRLDRLMRLPISK